MGLIKGVDLVLVLENTAIPQTLKLLKVHTSHVHG